MKKKIAFILNNYKDENFSSGGIKLDFMLIKSLSEMDFIVDIFTNKATQTKKNIINKIFNINDIKDRKNEYDLILSSKAIANSDITYIHDHSYLFRSKVLYNRCSEILYKIFNRKKYLKRIKEFENTKMNLANIKKVVVSSQILKSDMITNYGVNESRIIILPPPIDKYNIEKVKNNVFTFGISAVGFERKGGFTLLKSIKILKKEKKDFKVKIIYPSKNYYVKFLVDFYGIKDYCEFLPIQKNMEYFYNSIDCLLMPSVLEPFGMVATEALSVGCPVITGTNCGAADIIKDGYNGFIYEYTKKYEKKLAKQMSKMINLPYKDLDKLRKNASLSVQNQGETNFTTKYLEIMQELCNL